MGLKLSMEEEDQKELQLLPSQHSIASSSHMSSRPLDSPLNFRSAVPDQFETPPPDLQLSISLSPIQQPKNCLFTDSTRDYSDAKEADASSVEALKWQAAEQKRLAAIEKAYAKRVRELTRREMELAQSEFARARNMWERAREEVEEADRMKERATRQVDSSCMEITCQACRQRFRP
ncbi:protein indeterminate-domain 16 [Tripterygium wilfordii]|uniref:Protein indeterminate-domain 16 n=1 Tax=Tripterygium wilfordii TaxID=458696 RepID=A0A7J7DBG3_TRIWF|nr:zinc finger protein SHOOT GRAVITROPISM 5-like [Tripterygium wilfordii]KAF5743690.1 protein indeterminate-domain 16 [Tripterygium wilfordii]